MTFWFLLTPTFALADVRKILNQIDFSINIFIIDTGELYMWGTSSEGQTGLADEEVFLPQKLEFDDKVIAISCGYYHTAVITGNYELHINFNWELWCGYIIMSIEMQFWTLSYPMGSILTGLDSPLVRPSAGL